LHAYFDEDELDMIGLASAWLRHFLAAEMRSEDLMRLWGEKEMFRPSVTT
jgi:TBC1 domain family member 2